MSRDLTYNTPQFSVTNADGEQEFQFHSHNHSYTSIQDAIDETPPESFNSNPSNESLPGFTPIDTSEYHPSHYERLDDGSLYTTNSTAYSNTSTYSKDGASSSIYEMQSYETTANNDDASPFGGYSPNAFFLYWEEKEPDDYLHNPDPIEDAKYESNRFWYDLKSMDRRSFFGLLTFIFMFFAALGIFILLPILSYGAKFTPSVTTGIKLTDYVYPMISSIRTNLVDPDTPKEALTWTNPLTNETWPLVFSDEFNTEGRTFYDGDDQFFTAMDFHYAATNDLEWYDPDAVTTANGTLNLRLDAFKNHDLLYRSGMVQSWNKFCFTQGKIEFSARLPGYGNISGLWPGLWTMGNLGRPGYLATTDGVWPYTYSTCDAGITPNQSSLDGISYLPGQRLNSCTCPGEDHPNPGTGRGAPEIDVVEAQISGIGQVSQSLQVAPYDIWYMPDYSFLEIYNASITHMNTYAGGPFQQAVSGLTMLNTSWYEYGDTAHNFQKYGFEYLNDDTTGYVTWFVGDAPAWTVKAFALHPNGNVGWRQIPKEPLALIMNLGLSNNWAYIDWLSLVFPSTMSVDYVRLYQPEGQVNLGCDPEGYPTQEYIQKHLNIYENVNFTLYEDAGYTMPKNKLTGC